MAKGIWYERDGEPFMQWGRKYPGLKSPMHNKDGENDVVNYLCKGESVNDPPIHKRDGAKTMACHLC